MKFKIINIDVPDHDCDVVLKFANGKHITIQARPGNADVGYNGSLDVILHRSQPVTCWRDDHMTAAPAVEGQQHTRKTKQLATELP